MNSQQIEYVLTLAQLKSFSKAAQKLYVTQPSLSQYIMKTEEQLGIKIFDRSTSPIGLTEAGRAYVAYAERVKALDDELANQLADITKVRTGTLKIGASSFRASCLLPKSIAEFCRKFNRISVNIIEGDAERLAESVRNNELDVMIASGGFDERLFHTEELARERLYLAVARDNPLNERLSGCLLTADDIRGQSMKLITTPPISLGALDGERFIFADRGEYSAEELSPIFESAKIKPRMSLRVRTLETLFSFVNADFGVALIPDLLIKFGNYAVHPHYYAIDSALCDSKIYLVSRKNGYFSKSATEYCLILKQLVDIGTWRV